MATLADQTVGNIVKIPIDGKMWAFIVVHQGRPSTIYDTSFNGGTILLMQDCYESRSWNSSNVNGYANSTIHSYLNSTFLNLIDANIRAQIKQVKIPYRAGSGTSNTVSSGANGLAASVWLPSMPEVGFSGVAYAVLDGAWFSYFQGTSATGADAKRIAYLSGTITGWCLRSPHVSSTTNVWGVGNGGSYYDNVCSNSYGVRPALVLPNTMTISDDGTIITEAYAEGTLMTLPVGAKVVDPNTTIYDNPIVWTVADKNHPGYPADSVTLVSDKIIKIMAFDGAEASNSDTNRQSYGNNRYLYANIRQWMNKSGTNWYVAQHSADAAPTTANCANYNGYDTISGFLTGFSANMLAGFLDTTLRIAKPKVDGGGSETVTDKVFLLSKAEVGFGAENSIMEGSLLAMFSDNTSRDAYPTADAVANSNYTTSILNTSAGWHYWLRSPNVTLSYNVYHVYTGGSENNNLARNGYFGLRPAMNLRADSLIGAADANGVYFLFNQPPVIDGADSDLGTISENFTQAYTVTDPEGDAVVVTERVDGALIRTLPVTLGQVNTCTVGGLDFLRLLNGPHTLTITATDSNGGSTVRTYTFTKSVNTMSITLGTPLAADAMPTKAVLTITRQLPEGSTFLVEVCNNANDASPAWEDCTASVLAGRNHVFTNTAKAAAAWGVNFRVTAERNGAEGECHVTGVGGFFE